jgi:hypothetical protein
VTDSLTLKGTLEVGGGACASSCGSADRSLRSLALRCSTGQVFQTLVETAAPIRIATAGAVGASFVDLDLLGDLTSIEFLYMRSDAPILVRIGAAEPVLTGSAGTFPTLFAGGETLNLNFNGVAVSVAFLVTDQTAVQCAARINAACALAGLATPRASVLTTGQIQILGLGTGAASTLDVTGGTGAATLGFAGTPSDTGEGADVPLHGTLLIEFPQAGTTSPPPPSRVQVSGVAGIQIVAAGRS